VDPRGTPASRPDLYPQGRHRHRHPRNVRAGWRGGLPGALALRDNRALWILVRNVTLFVGGNLNAQTRPRHRGPASARGGLGVFLAAVLGPSFHAAMSRRHQVQSRTAYTSERCKQPQCNT
jgi:hypothetical protein